MEHHEINDEKNPATGRVGPVQWRKSSASNPSGDCVEVATLAGGQVAVRNSRDPRGPALVYTRAEVAAFIRGAKDGEFDDLIAPDPPVTEAMPSTLGLHSGRSNSHDDPGRPDAAGGQVST